MTEKSRKGWIGIRGPLTLSIGGTILTISLTFLLGSAISGYFTSAHIQLFLLAFAGFLITGFGLQMILDDRTK